MKAFFRLTLTALILSQLAPAQNRTLHNTTAAKTVDPAQLPTYAFDVPAGWARYDLDWGIAVVSPVFPNGETCQISMMPMQPAGANLANDTLNTFRTIFNTDPLTFAPFPYPKLEWGTSLQGWDYFVIRKSVGGRFGDPNLVGTIVLGAKVGNYMATVIATSKDSLVSSCLGEIIYDTWPVFLSSLHFENVSLSAVPEADIHGWLAGTWTAASGAVGLIYSFAPNGRYDDTGFYVGPVTTSAYFGNGTYSFDGNRMVFNGDDQRRTVRLFRLGGLSVDGGQSWKDQICLMDPAATGEVCYQRQ